MFATPWLGDLGEGLAMNRERTRLIVADEDNRKTLTSSIAARWLTCTAVWIEARSSCSAHASSWTSGCVIYGPPFTTTPNGSSASAVHDGLMPRFIETLLLSSQNTRGPSTGGSMSPGWSNHAHLHWSSSMKCIRDVPGTPLRTVKNQTTREAAGAKQSARTTGRSMSRNRGRAVTCFAIGVSATPINAH